MPPKPRTKDYIWKLIKKGESHECWEWLGHKSPLGYGVVGLGRKVYRAHRVVYELTNNVELPRIKKYATGVPIVMHTCDNPGCCNPKHLMLGTPSDNIWDMVKKGRRHNFDGERGARAKLTNEQAAEIRRLAWERVPQKELAQKYGVSVPTVSSIKHGIVYKDD